MKRGKRSPDPEFRRWTNGRAHGEREALEQSVFRRPDSPPNTAWVSSGFTGGGADWGGGKL